MGGGGEISSLRAGAHPLRLRMLSLLTGTAMSAAEIARELGITHANASYHLRVLLDAGALEVAGEERIRGGVAKRYRHSWREHRVFDLPSGGSLQPEIRAAAQELVRRFGEREPSTPMTFCDAELWVEEEVWTEVQALVRRAVETLHEAARPPRSEGAVRVNLTAAGFRMTATGEAR